MRGGRPAGGGGTAAVAVAARSRRRLSTACCGRAARHCSAGPHSAAIAATASAQPPRDAGVILGAANRRSRAPHLPPHLRAGTTFPGVPRGARRAMEAPVRRHRARYKGPAAPPWKEIYRRVSGAGGSARSFGPVPSPPWAGQARSRPPGETGRAWPLPNPAVCGPGAAVAGWWRPARGRSCHPAPVKPLRGASGPRARSPTPPQPGTNGPRAVRSPRSAAWRG